MKRTALLRHTPLRSTRPLQRKTRLRRVRHDRIRARRKKQFGAQASMCRTLPCLVCWSTPCDPHHVKSRGAGGLDEHCVPLDREHHDELHSIGRVAFEKKYRIDLFHEAARLAEVVSRGV